MRFLAEGITIIVGMVALAPVVKRQWIKHLRRKRESEQN